MEDTNSDQDRAERIAKLMPELDRRYAILHGILLKAIQGEAIDDCDLWLANGDLLSVIGVMDGSSIREEEDSFCL